MVKSFAQTLAVFALILNGSGVPQLLAKRQGLPLCLNQTGQKNGPNGSLDLCAHGLLCPGRRAASQSGPAPLV